MNQFVIILIVLVGVVLASAYNRPLYQSLLAGVLVLALFQRMPIHALADLVVLALFSFTNAQLVIAIAIVSIVAKLLEKNGILQDMVDALSSILGSLKTTIVIVPALVGVIPFSGGAILSAPLVDALGDKLGVSASRRAAINLYFRHGWYFLAPYRPAIILAAGLAAVDLGALIKVQIPLVIFGIAVGYMFMLRRIKEPKQVNSGETPRKPEIIKKFLRLSLPLTVPLVLFLIFTDVSIAAVMLSSLVIAVYLTRSDFKWVCLYRYIDKKLVGNMAAILIFSAMMRELSDLSTAMGQLVELGLPLAVLTFLLPLGIGFFSADSVASVGLSFPLLINLLPPGSERLGYVMLMSASAFFGYFTSPVHLCQVLTIEYFKINLLNVYREYVIPILLFAIFAMLWAALYLYLV